MKSRINSIFKQNFILILQTGALTFDRKYDKRIAHGVVATGLQIPNSLFSEEGYDEYDYATNILDFEYGLFDAAGEDYPAWVNNYWEWKSKQGK